MIYIILSPFDLIEYTYVVVGALIYNSHIMHNSCVGCRSEGADALYRFFDIRHEPQGIVYTHSIPTRILL